MTVDTQETRLATRYEKIRRREYEVINKLLELLPKIDTLDEGQITQVRDALFHADHPFLMVFVGPFSSGKSSLINALLGEGGLLPVGPVPTTDRIHILRWGDEPQRMSSGGEVETVFHPSPLLEKVSFVDTPGLESIFQKHEETTRSFLHRSDVVLLVMLATQAMTSRNLEYLQQLRQYGKKVIIVINQADLLSDDEVETLREYVINQSEDRLAATPEVWMMSAKQGLEARKSEEFDEALWNDSGLWHLEAYIDEQLGDIERMRQKLQTPLQIVQNTHSIALEAVKGNQKVLDQYQSIADNVQQQLDAYKREQLEIVRELNSGIEEKFTDSRDRAKEAIQDIFQLSRAIGSVGRGFADLTGIARLFRRGSKASYTRLAFERHKVFEPISQLPDVSDKLGPRLEGKDLQDIDDLVRYTNNEIKALPETIRGKVIGNVQPPAKYDRTVLHGLRDNLEQIEARAREVETQKMDQNLRNVLFILAIWEVLVLAVLALIVFGGALNFNEPSAFIVVIFILAFGLIGLLALPLAGRILETSYVNRLLKVQADYIDTLTKAADRQIEYGMRLRRDIVAPLTRLVETQTQLQTDQLNNLQAIEQELVEIESELTRMRKTT